MTIDRRALLIAAPLTFLAAGALNAAPKSSWEGTWTGMWEGQYDTSITITGNMLVKYTYRGYSVPFTRARVTPDLVSFGREYSVTVTKTSETTASAKYHG